MSTFNVEQVTNDCIAWIKDWFNNNGKDCNAVIGISGGKDSSVVAALCVAALGKNRVIGILMPQGVQHDINYSEMLVHHLGIKYYVHNIAATVDSVLDRMRHNHVEISKQTVTNLPARIRMSTLYAYSQSLNGRVANTCNSPESLVGWETRWGDAVGDFSPLRWLTTRQIRAIGEYLDLPKELVQKPPIDGLTFNEDGTYKTDEDNLGVTYEEIDNYIESNYDSSAISKKSFERIMELIQKSEFKRKDIPSFIPKHMYDDMIQIF